MLRFAAGFVLSPPMDETPEHRGVRSGGLLGFLANLSAGGLACKFGRVSGSAPLSSLLDGAACRVPDSAWPAAVSGAGMVFPAVLLRFPCSLPACGQRL